VYCDALTLSAVADELRSELVGGRVQEVLAVDGWTLGLEIYTAAHATHGGGTPTGPGGRRRYLLISANPSEGGRIHLAAHKLRRGMDPPSPLLLRLRKNVEGARFTDIGQPPRERVLHLHFAGSEGFLTLTVEVMGRLSNILLVEEDGTILECQRRVTSRQSRYRVVLPGQPYTPPPAQHKAEAQDLTPGQLTRLLEQVEGEPTLWRRLVATLRGVSPIMAKEVVYRATGEVAAPAADSRRVLDRLVDLQCLAQTRQWQPSVATEQGQVIAFAPYPLTHYPVTEQRQSISAAMSDFYEQQTGADAYAAAKSRVQGLIAHARQRQERKRQALQRSSPSAGAVDDLRLKGKLLFAFAHQISPRQTEVTLTLGEGEPVIRIAMDPNLSPTQNAQEYFRRYEKARSASAEVPGLAAEVDEELNYLDQLSTDLALAQHHPGIAAIESALAATGHIPKPARARPVAASPLRVESDDGLVIWVGRNSRQNEEVTFRIGTGRDVWLHAEGVPGAHVLIRTEGHPVPQRTLLQAAQLAARHSAVREDPSVRVAYTLRQNVHRSRGGKPRQVILGHYDTIVVRPEAGAES